jgi:type I restriction enzyme S subunit
MAKKTKDSNLSLEERLQQALIPNWDEPYKLPPNWCWSKLGSVSELYNGDRGANYPSKRDYVSEGIPFINAGAIQNNILDETEFNFISKEKYEALRAGKIKKDDILYCLRGSLGKTALIATNLTGAISSSLCIIRAKNNVIPKYLFYLLRSNFVVQQQIKAENGSAQPNLSAASVMEYVLPIAPLEEQKRIVSRIESLFSKLDETQEKAQEVVDGFETRKAAILHKAFSGELTAKWREENGEKYSDWKFSMLGNHLYPMRTKKPSGEVFRYIDIDSIDNINQCVEKLK